MLHLVGGLSASAHSEVVAPRAGRGGTTSSKSAFLQRESSANWTCCIATRKLASGIASEAIEGLVREISLRYSKSQSEETKDYINEQVCAEPNVLPPPVGVQTTGMYTHLKRTRLGFSDSVRRLEGSRRPGGSPYSA